MAYRTSMMIFLFLCVALLGAYPLEAQDGESPYPGSTQRLHRS